MAEWVPATKTLFALFTRIQQSPTDHNQDYNPWADQLQRWRILRVENVREIVARNVRLTRQRMGISQEELADRAGVDRSYGSRIERGSANPSVEILAKLAEVLGVTVASLLETKRTGP